MAVKGGDKLIAKLRGIAESSSNGKAVRVGFMDKAIYPDDTPVAMVAAIQNYGAPAAGIPARPFFGNMVKAKSPDWGHQLGTVLTQTNFDASRALGLMGDVIVGQLQDAIENTKSPPLAQSTIDAKGFSQPLIDTGHMQNSVTAVVVE